MAGTTPEKVTADAIAVCLARNTFKDALVVVDRCMHTGYECDLLVVAPCLRYIDVEIKISRADLKADRRKDKWHSWPAVPWGQSRVCVPRDWPPRVWKHYYAMPETIWRDDMLAHCGAISGVLLVQPNQYKARNWRLRVVRRAKPCRNAPQATSGDIMAVARLASLRMWDAYEDAWREAVPA